jgi:hypothetical protein
MKTQTIFGTACLAAGVVLGAFVGVWLDRRGDEERKVAAIEAEAARTEVFEAEVSRLQEHVDLAELHLRLGRIAMEADRQDYGAAGERATHFFDDVARMAEQAEADGQARAALRQVLAARDELIAGLATAQPSAAERLKQLYLDLFATDVASSAAPGSIAAGEPPPAG